MKISTRTSDLIIAYVFAAFITIPLIFTAFGLHSGAMGNENRITVAPKLQFEYSAKLGIASNLKNLYISTARYINKFDAYFSSTFSFRHEFLSIHNAIKSNLLHVNPLPGKVVEGEQGWMFPGDNQSNVIKETKGLKRFSQQQLSSIGSVLSNRVNWLKKRNIKYYQAVAPDKLSVYGRHLDIKQSARTTKTMQVDSVASGIGCAFINLKTDFPVSEFLFIKTDTHWNDYGAFIAYNTLMRTIIKDFPELIIQTEHDYAVDTVVVFQQDLTKLLSQTRKDDKIQFRHLKPLASKFIESKYYQVPASFEFIPGIYEQRYKGNKNKVKAIIFRDSFTSNMEQYLNETFGEVLYIWRHEFNETIIEKEKPDIVMDIVVEREIDLLLKTNWNK